ADFHLIGFHFLTKRHIKPHPAITANPCAPYPADADGTIRHPFRARMDRRERPEPDARKASAHAFIGWIVKGERYRAIDPLPLKPAFCLGQSEFLHRFI